MRNVKEMKGITRGDGFMDLLKNSRGQKTNEEIENYIIEDLRESVKDDSGRVSYLYMNKQIGDMSTYYESELGSVVYAFKKRGYDVTLDDEHKKLHIDMTNTNTHDDVHINYSHIPYAKDLYGMMPSHRNIKRDEYLEKIENQMVTRAKDGKKYFETDDFGFNQPLDDTTLIQNEIIELLKENGYDVKHQKLDDIEIMKQEMVKVLKENGYDIKPMPQKSLYSLRISWK